MCMRTFGKKINQVNKVSNQAGAEEGDWLAAGRRWSRTERENWTAVEVISACLPFHME